MSSYIELTKPRITVFILMSTAIGFLCGAHAGGAWTILTLLHTLVGTGLIASGTAALNQWYERDADARMNRTKARPIPSGRVTPSSAFWFAVALSIVGFVELWLGANRLTALLGLFTLVSYLFVYTPLKQKSPHSTTIGAIPGAMPPLIGYAAAAGLLNTQAWILYAILFLWQFPHFYAIAWMYREDYERAGIRMLPVVEPDIESTARRIWMFSLVLIPISLLPKFTDMAGNVYLFGALALGLFFLYASVRAAFDRTRPRARQVLLASVVYLPLLYGLLVFDRPNF
jgi:protoheme IX farnesyltransferase